MDVQNKTPMRYKGDAVGNRVGARLVLARQPLRVKMRLGQDKYFMRKFFHTNVFCPAFMCLQYGLEILWQKDFGAKAAHKM